MSTTRDPRGTAPLNIQDVFLNHVRRERLPVSIEMLNGRELNGRIRSFDRFAVIVEIDGSDQMIFKHAIATIRSPRSAGSDPAPRDA